MENNNHRKLQLLQLKIALEVKRICDKYSIPYFLDCGSLLGTVRHQGFIPWDDDMDMGFLRENYDLFIEAAKQDLNEEFCLQTWETDADFPQPYAKICLKNTVYQEKKGSVQLGKYNGIFIDIFPYDNIADNKCARKLNGIMRKIISHTLMIKCGYKVWEGESRLKLIKFLPFICISRFTTKDVLKKYFNKLARMYQNVMTEEVGIEDGGITLHWHIKRNVLEELMEGQFEGKTFTIPVDYDVYLKQVYGNYMELPPEDKRWIGHAIEHLDFGPYKEE